MDANPPANLAAQKQLTCQSTQVCTSMCVWCLKALVIKAVFVLNKGPMRLPERGSRRANMLNQESHPVMKTKVLLFEKRCLADVLLLKLNLLSG